MQRLCVPPEDLPARESRQTKSAVVAVGNNIYKKTLWRPIQPQQHLQDAVAFTIRLGFESLDCGNRDRTKERPVAVHFERHLTPRQAPLAAPLVERDIKISQTEIAGHGVRAGDYSARKAASGSIRAARRA